MLPGSFGGNRKGEHDEGDDHNQVFHHLKTAFRIALKYCVPKAIGCT